LTVVGVLLLLVGALLLLLSLAGVMFGLFMALDRRTRESGAFFALWWVPAVAAAGGVLMRDLVTFAVGVFCFVAAGAAFALEHRRGPQRPTRGKRSGSKDPEKHLLFEEAKRRLSGWLSKKAKHWSERAKHWLSGKVKDREYRRDIS
jgi:hypothetical protein